jgi:hypothetical protein
MDNSIQPIELTNPRVLPVARDTWEVQIFLSRTLASSGRVSVTLPRTCKITGFKTTVIQASFAGGGLLVPSDDDLLCSFDLNEERRFTATKQTNFLGAQPNAFVTLSALSDRERLLMILAEGANPDLGFEIVWKNFTAGTPRYEDAHISIAMFIQREGQSQL